MSKNIVQTVTMHFECIKRILSIVNIFSSIFKKSYEFLFTKIWNSFE